MGRIMNTFSELLQQGEQPKVLVIGDFLRDEYIYGDVKRMSPEAPVPIINVTNKEYKLGGAGNVVNNLLAMGADVHTIFAAGVDDASYWLQTELSRIINDSKVIKVQMINTWKVPTKTRFISGIQQMLRVDEEIIGQNMHYSDADNFYDSFSDLIRTVKLDMVILSDYGKGSLPEKLVQKIIRVCNRFDLPTIVDPSGKNFEKYFSCTCIKPNRKELNRVLALEEVDDEDTWREGLKHLIDSYNLQHALLTLSDNGVAVMEKKDRQMHLIPAKAQYVYDVCGAGDTTLSAYAISICKGLSPQQAAYVANVAGGISCSHIGTYVVCMEEIIDYLENEIGFTAEVV